MSLDIEAEPEIGAFEADPRRIRQILFHLLANAIGFSSPGQSVRIAVKREASDMVFEVSDQGRGIPRRCCRASSSASRATRALEPSRRRLGLSMVKAFVELHKGHVTLDSEPGRGTIVTCRFPTSRTRESDAPPQMPQGTQTRAA